MVFVISSTTLVNDDVMWIIVIEIYAFTNITIKGIFGIQKVL
jgi:hypothetical protein